MHVALLRRDDDRVTDRGVRAAVDARDDVGALAVHVGVTVEVAVGAELLDDVDRDGQALAGGRHDDVLRADAHRDVARAGVRQGVAVDRVVERAELDAALDDVGREQVHGRRTDEAGDEHVVRLLVEVARRADLLEDAVLEHRDAVAHGERLGLVVRDVDRGDAEAALERRDLGAGLDAELGVEVRQRLVHEEHLGLTDDRAAHRDALTLTTGERLRLAAEVLLEVEELGGLLHAGGALLLADAGDLEREAHVLGDGHVRVQRVVLEHHRDVAVLRRDVGDVALADADGAGVDLFEAGEHAQGGGLAAARGADEDEELAVGDVQVEGVDRGAGASGVETGCLVVGDGRHERSILPSPAGTCRTIRCEAVARGGPGWSPSTIAAHTTRLPRAAPVSGATWLAGPRKDHYHRWVRPAYRGKAARTSGST
ncbi:phenol hydroxylase [Curtobacterium sp. ER1/6]|nr:phenol hydroxylase [Curtobacterium sp. ER1/6]